jgi:DNA-binding transcriptional LysR family regulator
VIVSSGKYETLNDIVQDPQVKIIVFEQGCVYRARLESWLSYKGIINYKSTVVNSLEGIVNFVEAGLAITILPLELIEQYYPNRQLRTFSIGKELGSTTTMIIYRKNREPDPYATGFYRNALNKTANFILYNQ